MSHVTPSERPPSGGGTSRREFLKHGGSAVAAMSVLGLAGCGSGSSSSGGAGSGTGTVKIGMTSDLFPAFTQKGPKGQPAPFAQFTAQHNIKVKVVTESSDTDTYFENIRTQLEAESAVVDVIAGDVSWPAQFASQGWLTDLSSRFTPAARAAFLPAVIDSNTYKGKIYGVPFFTDDGFLYYRKDLLDKSGYSGPPQTWAELQEMSQKVMRDHKLKYGFTFTGADYEGGTLLGMEFVKTSGGTVISGNTVSANSPQAIAGLTTARSLITNGISPKAVTEYQEGQVEAPFIAGNSVFLRNWGYMFSVLSDPKQSKVHPSQVGVASVPRASTAIAPVNVGGGWNLYLNGYSQNQDAAWKLMQFMSSPAQQMNTMETIEYTPTLSALFHDSQLLKAVPFSAPAVAKQVVFETITPPKSPYYKDMSAAMAAQFQANLLGKVTPTQAAENVQTQLEQIVKRGAAA
jgi:multiple sugar transport system substrate-binding protein